MTNDQRPTTNDQRPTTNDHYAGLPRGVRRGISIFAVTELSFLSRTMPICTSSLAASRNPRSRSSRDPTLDPLIDVITSPAFSPARPAAAPVDPRDPAPRLQPCPRRRRSVGHGGHEHTVLRAEEFRELPGQLFGGHAESPVGHERRAEVEVEVERRHTVAEPAQIASEIAPVVADEVAGHHHVAATLVGRDLHVAPLTLAGDRDLDRSSGWRLPAQPRQLTRAPNPLAVELDDDV